MPALTGARVAYIEQHAHFQDDITMKQSDWEKVIAAAMGPASEYLKSLPDRAVYRPVADPEELRKLFGGPLPP